MIVGGMYVCLCMVQRSDSALLISNPIAPPHTVCKVSFQDKIKGQHSIISVALLLLFMPGVLSNQNYQTISQAEGVQILLPWSNGAG